MGITLDNRTRKDKANGESEVKGVYKGKYKGLDVKLEVVGQESEDIEQAIPLNYQAVLEMDIYEK